MDTWNNSDWHFGKYQTVEDKKDQRTNELDTQIAHKVHEIKTQEAMFFRNN